MSRTIHIDTSQLHEEFERTLDEVYLTHHYHQTNIPNLKMSESERQNIAITDGYARRGNGAIGGGGKHPVNGLPAGWNQDGGSYQQFGGGAISGGCVVGALLIGVAIAIGIILVGIL